MTLADELRRIGGRSIDFWGKRQQRRQRLLADRLLETPRFFGLRNPVSIGANTQVHNALFNAASGPITVEDWAFFGHDVRLLTGTHQVTVFDHERQSSAPDHGRGITIKHGAWIASGATILGPCVVGEHAVVAAGAVVTADVEAYTVVAGVPARLVRRIESRPA